jgi:hypothetical protein
MHPGVIQIMLGLLCIVGGILIVKALGNEWGWLLFTAGGVIASKGAIGLSSSGAKEIGN